MRNQYNLAHREDDALIDLLQRAPNLLLIPGTSSVAHLQQNLAVAGLKLPADAVARLNTIASES